MQEILRGSDAGRGAGSATTVSSSRFSESPSSAHSGPGAPEPFASLRGSGPPTLLTGDDLFCRIDKRSSVGEDGRCDAENHPGPTATVSPSSRPSGPRSPSSAHIIGLDLRRSLLIGSPASLASLGDGDDQTLLTGDDADGSSSDDAPFGGRVEDMSDLMLLIARLQLPSAQKVQQQREWRADRSQRETGVVRRSSSARGRSVSIDPRPPERIFSSAGRAFGTTASGSSHDGIAGGGGLAGRESELPMSIIAPGVRVRHQSAQKIQRGQTAVCRARSAPRSVSFALGAERTEHLTGIVRGRSVSTAERSIASRRTAPYKHTGKG